MATVLKEYKALQALAEVKRIAYNHNRSVDDFKVILKKSIPFSYHLCIDDLLKQYYIKA